MSMKSFLVAALCALLMASSGRALRQGVQLEEASTAAVRAVMRKAADWQLAHPKHDLRDWTNGVFYAGIMAIYHATGEQRYLDALMSMGRRNRWRPGPRHRHADDHAIAQTYLDLFRITQDRLMYRSFQEAVDRMMASPPDWSKKYQPIDYWWCDALFMSPPAFAKLAAVTGEEKYLDFMDKLWRQAYDLLYDRDENLFVRDMRDLDGRRRSYSGGQRERVYWSRGNGWVLAGTAKLLEELPEDRPSRRFYVGVFKEMAERIATIQPEDGLWRPSLLGPASASAGESSGTALFCYALAWGVNRGILDRGRFLPVIDSGWSALLGNVDEKGRLGWVQRIGRGPERVGGGDSDNYGTGTFLLAGSQVLKLRIDLAAK